MICTVAQHAVTSELMTVIFPRDTLAIETVTYSAIKGLAQELGLRLEALTMDREGVVPDAFKRLCQIRPPKALYCLPTLHCHREFRAPPDHRRYSPPLPRRP